MVRKGELMPKGKEGSWAGFSSDGRFAKGNSRRKARRERETFSRPRKFAQEHPIFFWHTVRNGELFSENHLQIVDKGRGV